MIDIQGLGKQLGSTRLLQHITLQVQRGEVLGLIGPNGAGKSTLLSILATLSPYTTGEVSIAGHDLRREQQTVRRLLGYVPQEIAVYPLLSVQDNLTFWATMYGLKQPQQRIEEIAGILGLQEHLGQKVKHLSGGYARRVNIAVALLHAPQILLMDEPTVGMDIYSKRELLPSIKHWAKEEGMTIIYTSHDAQELLYLCDRLALLEQGRLVYEGTLDEAKEKLTILQGIE